MRQRRSAQSWRREAGGVDGGVVERVGRGSSVQRGGEEPVSDEKERTARVVSVKAHGPA
jgi:hypothetical protein